MLSLIHDVTTNPSSTSVNGNGALAQGPGEVKIRALASADAAALRTLAERDSAAVPEGGIVGAERDGYLLAAISLSSGRVVADPFRPTADLVALLRLRAGQFVAVAA